MSAETFDPEVVELLREVVADPASTLTRMPPERLKRWIPGPEEVISPHGSYLTKAERHLALAYREQAAWVLLHACIERLTPGDSLVFSPARVRPDVLRRSAGRFHERSVEEPAGSLLGSVARGEEPTASQLATAALRLVPSDAARNCLAAALHKEGSSLGGLRLLKRILANQPSVVFRSLAWENQGLIHSARKEYRRACECYDWSVRAMEDRLRPRVWLLTMALQIGDEASAVAADKRINDGRFADEPLFDEWVARLDGSLTARTWEPTRESLILIPRLGDRLTEKARRISDVFTQN